VSNPTGSTGPLICLARYLYSTNLFELKEVNNIRFGRRFLSYIITSNRNTKQKYPVLLQDTVRQSKQPHCQTTVFSRFVIKRQYQPPTSILIGSILRSQNDRIKSLKGQPIFAPTTTLSPNFDRLLVSVPASSSLVFALLAC
jgi:hypothetical protein